jgi:hypothetical protein
METDKLAVARHRVESIKGVKKERLLHAPTRVSTGRQDFQQFTH